MKILLTTCLMALSTGAMASEVNVYSYRQPELVKPLFDEFTKDTGIKVNVAFLSKGMVEKLQAEGNRSPADLVFTSDISRLSSVVNAGVTQPVTSEILEANIPAAFQSKDNHWFGLTTRARVVYASKDRVADGDITTYEDLTNPKWKGRICTRSGIHSYNLALVSAMISHHGEAKTSEWIDGVKANLARKPQGNDRAQVKAIHAGECDISLGNTYYMGLMQNNEDQQDWANSVRIVFPTFEGDGTHVNMSGMALTKAAPNKDNAIKLMEFLASDKGQGIYADVVHEYPVKAGVLPSENTQSWGAFTPDSIAVDSLSALRKASVRLMQTANFDE